MAGNYTSLDMKYTEDLNFDKHMAVVSVSYFLIFIRPKIERRYSDPGSLSSSDHFRRTHTTSSSGGQVSHDFQSQISQGEKNESTLPHPNSLPSSSKLPPPSTSTGNKKGPKSKDPNSLPSSTKLPQPSTSPGNKKGPKSKARGMKSSRKPHLFLSNSKKPTQDPREMTKEIEEQLRKTATSEETFEQLKLHYSKIRSKIIESSKKFRYSSYRLRLGPNPETRTDELRLYIREVMRRQAVGCRVNIGTGNLIDIYFKK